MDVTQISVWEQEMTITTRTEQILAAIGLLLFIAAMAVWQQYRVDRARAEEKLAALEDQRKQSDDLIRQTNDQLKAAMAALDQAKRQVQTPSQVIREIPQYLPSLPAPITVTTPEPTKDNPRPEPTEARVPAADLKPIFDTLVEGKQCQAQLQAANITIEAKDSQIKTVANERDEYKKLSKGGSFFQRFGRAVKWIAVGAGVALGTRAIIHGFTPEDQWRTELKQASSRSRMEPAASLDSSQQCSPSVAAPGSPSW